MKICDSIPNHLFEAFMNEILKYNIIFGMHILIRIIINLSFLSQQIKK